MGYNTKKVDVNWWIDQINAGIRFRERHAYQQRWPDWRAYYRGEFGDNVLPLNFYFMLLRALVPRVYFKNPAISVTPAKPGLMGVVFAQIQERIDNKLIVSMKIKKQIKKMVQDAFMFGTGVGKLGYGAQYTPSPAEGDVEAPLTKRGSVEYRAGILPNMPWFGRVHPGNYIVPPG